MFILQQVGVCLVVALLLIAHWPRQYQSLIITSVIAGDKKFKTVSFHSKLLKPLMFEKELPNTEFRRHRTMRPPKFDIDVNIPIKLPLEEEYPYEERKKPHTSELFFQTDEIREPSYGKPPPPPALKQGGNGYTKTAYDEMARAASFQKGATNADIFVPKRNLGQPNTADLVPFKGSPETAGRPLQASASAIADAMEPMMETGASARADARLEQAASLNGNVFAQPPVVAPVTQQLAAQESYTSNNYAAPQDHYQQPTPEFVPGGFVNLKLSGPTGGPQMTYEDHDREKWAQQLSQTLHAMPYPILNYQQLQNFYGGLGTFTNGLPENRYAPTSIFDKLKMGMNHFTSKLHIG